MKLLNYRPVSVMSIVSKLCKMIVKIKWVQHLEKDKIIHLNRKAIQFQDGKVLCKKSTEFLHKSNR